LTRQQRPHHRAVENLAGDGGVLAEQVLPGQQANSRFRRREQPADRVTSHAVHRAHAAITVIHQPQARSGRPDRCREFRKSRSIPAPSFRWQHSMD
jgi:hypothetical protein